MPHIAERVRVPFWVHRIHCGRSSLQVPHAAEDAHHHADATDDAHHHDHDDAADDDDYDAADLTGDQTAD